MQIPSILTHAYADLPFPQAIDNSMLSSLRKCEGAGHYAYLENLAPVGTSVHLHAGASFAFGVEHARRAFYIDGKTPDEAVGIGISQLLAYYGDFECPPESPKSALRMAGALEFYFDQYGFDTDYVKPWTDGKSHGIEFSFSMPLSVPHPQSGDPLIYVGRFDMLGQHNNGGLFVVDEKTATSLGQSWVNQWELDSQFTGYCAGARLYNKPVVGAIIRGVSILKTKYDTKEAIIYRSDWQIARWWNKINREAQRMIEIWKNPDDIRWALDKASCGAYGGCTYRTLCNSPTPNTWKPVNFEPRSWHPMLREEREAEIKALQEAAK